MIRSLLGGVALASIAAGGLVAPPGAGAATPSPGYQLNQLGHHVTVLRGAGGVPHITGADFASVGYGYGLAFAQDNLCTMAADYVTVEARRSLYFGPTAGYAVVGNGTTENNLDSDVFWQGIQDSGIVDRLATATSGPNALAPQLRQLGEGYVDGYNRRLADVGGPAGITDPACRGAAWVHPITERDVYLRLYQLVELASGDVVIHGIAEAAPPLPGTGVGAGAGAPTLTPEQIRQISGGLAAAGAGGRAAAVGGTAGLHPEGGLGSNAVAVGSAGTRDRAHGLLLGNPHFPWEGTERFYQAQLTIPGQLDVEGASLFGVPVILIGHTRTMAWSHTVSTAYRFTPYQLTLVPGTPTTYLQDGTPIPMTSRPVSIPLQGGGSYVHTLYSTRYGPVFDSLQGIPLPWTGATAFALGDANAENFRAFNHFFQTNLATSVADELTILKSYEGIPWVNTIVADSTGHALYADIGTVPHVTDAQAQTCDTALGAATFAQVRLPILDGSRTACDWGSDQDSVVPGIFGGNEQPSLARSDYVTNSNDSFWLSNPAQPLTGFPLIIGDTGTARSLRTRIGLIMTAARIDGSDGHGPAGFTRQDMQDLVFNDRQYGAELVDDALVTLCRSFPGGQAPTSSGGPVSVGSSCDTLAAWDRHENVDSRGAVLFRGFWERALAVPGGPFSTPFSAADPVHTPNGLTTANPLVQQAFGDALAAMRGAHLADDVALGQVQYVTLGGRRIPIHGGPGDPDGDFNAIYTDVVGTPGTTPSLGSSYVQVVTWHDGQACPDSRTILTYSESSDPTSAYHDDQTRLYADKQWIDDGFCAASVHPATVAATARRPASTQHKAAAPHRGHRPAVRHPAASPAQPTRTLAFTGLDGALPSAAAGCAAAAALLARRRRDHRNPRRRKPVESRRHRHSRG